MKRNIAFIPCNIACFTSHLPVIICIEKITGTNFATGSARMDASVKQNGLEIMKTIILNDSPLILYHQAFNKATYEEHESGTWDPINLIRQSLGDPERFDLILDMTGHDFYSIEYYRFWSAGFKQNSFLQERVEKVALIGDDTKTFYIEKQMMETEELKFFIDVKSAFEWLCPMEIHA